MTENLRVSKYMGGKSKRCPKKNLKTNSKKNLKVLQKLVLLLLLPQHWPGLNILWKRIL